jgi:hypothetical protein
MKRLAIIAALLGAAAWLASPAPAVARSTPQDDPAVSADKKPPHKHKHLDGGTGDEEREEEFRSY